MPADPKAVRILSRIRYPEGWRHWDKDETELTLETLKVWQRKHSVKTPAGSVLFGTVHPDMSNPETPGAKAILELVIPAAKALAKKALAKGQKVVQLSEGWAQEYFGPLEGKEANENHAVACALHEAFGDQVVQDTWDDWAVDVFEEDSPIWAILTSAADDDIDLAHAAVTCFLAGQGDDLADLRKRDIYTQGAERHIQEHLGSPTADEMYRLSFPGDFGEPHTVYSALGEVFNVTREGNLLQKIRGVEIEGGITITIAGSGHAFALKPVLEKAVGGLSERVAKRFKKPGSR